MKFPSIQRRHGDARSIDSEFWDSPFYSAASSKELLYFFCWKNQPARVEPSSRVVSPAPTEEREGNDNVENFADQSEAKTEKRACLRDCFSGGTESTVTWRRCFRSLLTLHRRLLLIVVVVVIVIWVLIFSQEIDEVLLSASKPQQQTGKTLGTSISFFPSLVKDFAHSLWCGLHGKVFATEQGYYLKEELEGGAGLQQIGLQKEHKY
ncbi:hypothetical protein Goshw_017300 [Gossypium schwendimanii]|uniref:Uncharacterized protein n=1 Tax=Gossypium schwendimanii TaxID=34291 RepID=A0A7J9LP32_GOSSC|nr:hypothetical protein [Gossypium schwendimanii]